VLSNYVTLVEEVDELKTIIQKYPCLVKLQDGLCVVFYRKIETSLRSASM
jgi:hypothetical protein